LALTHLKLAELLLEENDGAGAIEHLDFAIPELRGMRMRPALEGALALVPLAKLQPPPQGSPLVASGNLTKRELEVSDQKVGTFAPGSPLSQRQQEVALLGPGVDQSPDRPASDDHGTNRWRSHRAISRQAWFHFTNPDRRLGRGQYPRGLYVSLIGCCASNRVSLRDGWAHVLLGSARLGNSRSQW
jgi:hypothetical protein